MLDDLFPFVDPIVELNEDNTCFVIQADIFYDFIQKFGLDKATHSPDGGRIELPLDVVMSLLKPDELEKLQKYIAAYLAQHPQP